MAIPNLEWLLHPILCPPYINPPSLVPPCTARKLLIVWSSGSSSSLLNEASNDLHHQIQFNPKPSSFGSPTTSGISGSDTDVLTERSEEELSLEHYHKARLHPGFRLDKETLNLLIRKLLRSKNWDMVSALSNDIRSSGIYPDKAMCIRLVDGCIKARKFRNAESLLGTFKARKEIAVVTFGAALRGYNKLHMYSNAVVVYEKMMKKGGVLLDAGCYRWIMEAYGKLHSTDKVVSLFEEFETKKLESSPELNAQIYFVVCDSLGRAGRAFEALRYFREINNKGGFILPGTSLYSSLICSFAGINEAEIAEDLFDEARKKGLIKDPALFLKLVLMYVELGRIGKTLEIVKVMNEIGMGVSDCIFCAVINGHVKKRGLRASVMAYEEMISLGCVPGQVTYASVINVYCCLGLVAKAESIFHEMLEKGFHKCVVAYSNIVSMYGKAGRVRDATRLLAKMKEKGCKPNVWVYNSLIDMHGRGANVKQVVKLWKEMKRKKIRPDKVSYTSIIGAYNKAKEFNGCVEFYQEFRSHGGKIDRVLAGIMVGVFSKTNSMDELLNLLHELKVEGVQFDERLYMSSLNALRDSGLQAQVSWFRDTFTYQKIKGKS